MGRLIVFFYPPTAVARLRSSAWDQQLGPEEREGLGSGRMDGEGTGQGVEREKNKQARKRRAQLGLQGS